eukprot:5485023-Amphidinium_carterae.1
MIWQKASHAARNAHKHWCVLTPSQRALSTGYTKPMFSMTPPLNLSEANIKAELLSDKVLPDTFVNFVVAKRASTVEDILTLLLQRYLPSEPTARVDALASVETHLKPAKTSQEALTQRRKWKDQLLIVTETLQGRPDIYRLYMALQPLLSSLMYTPAFSVAHANILALTSIKLTPTPQVLWQYVDLLEAEFNDRALEEHEYSRQKPQAHGAEEWYDADTYGTEKGKGGKGKGKDKKGKDKKGSPSPQRTYHNRDNDPSDTRPICTDFLTDRGCNKGGQCRLRHPPTPGKCLRCGGNGHSVQECRRPRRDKPAPKPQPHPGKGASNAEWAE